MKKIVRFIFPVLLALLVVSSVLWYLFVYDRDFTRDMLLREARVSDMAGNSAISAWFYKLAYAHSGNDEAVAIELSNQYKDDGNYTKAEVTLSNAINASPSVELYVALCRTFVEQDKIRDAVSLLESIPDPELKAQIDARRPSAPASSQIPGFHSQYIDVDLSSSSSMLLYALNDDYPSIHSAPYSEPIHLSAGETIIRSISIDNAGLISPMSVLGYTVEGVIEEAVFVDENFGNAVKDTLGKSHDTVLYTNELWPITDFTTPSNAQSLVDLALLPHLNTLIVTSLPAGGLQDVAALKELTELDLTGCRFVPSELSDLAKLPYLVKLVISDCGLSTIDPLAGVTGLTSLDVSRNTIRKLDVLSTMPNLRELYLNENAVSDLTALSSLYALEILNVASNDLTSLAPLVSCTSLSWLDASNNRFDTIAGISDLRMLTSLSLNYNRLTDISPLGACMQLKELYINNNEITDITMLSSLVNLEKLDFSYNSVSFMPTWMDGNAMQKIQGSHNLLQNADSMVNMNNLTHVFLDYNQLSDISALENCCNLVQINVFGNAISDVSALTQHSIIVNYDPT